MVQKFHTDTNLFKILSDEIYKAAACRTFNVKRSTLIDSLKRLENRVI